METGTDLGVDVTALMEHVDAFAADWMAAEHMVAVQLAVTDRDGLLARRAYGYADLAAREPLTDDHLFEFGSIGKSFTAILCLQLADEGVLDLHVPVTTYLPWFFVPSRHEPITIHHLLTHTAGIIGGSDFSPDPRYEVWALRESEASAPGVKSRYSNAGYKLLRLDAGACHRQAVRPTRDRSGSAPLGMTGAEGYRCHEPDAAAIGGARSHVRRPPVAA
ncbi:MAG: serine hydrolase domain-containing protein [Thermomicrobiales bacterium]